MPRNDYETTKLRGRWYYQDHHQQVLARVNARYQEKKEEPKQEPMTCAKYVAIFEAYNKAKENK